MIWFLLACAGKDPANDDTGGDSVDPASVDVDGDGWSSVSDCSDEDAAIHPEAAEACDGVDNDCDGRVDDDDVDDVTGVTDWYLDADADGYGDAGSTWAACAAPDGFVADATDCDDLAGTTSPGAPELCNGADDDCDGTVDEDPIDSTEWWQDADGDSYGAGFSVFACEAPSEDATSVGGDCDDADADAYPGAPESCDGDLDCDGLSGDDDPDVIAPAWYADADGDGHGDETRSRAACAPPEGAVAMGDDCDDTDAAVNPDAAESCDGRDDDCDGLVDDDDTVTGAVTWWVDGDGDGFGSSALGFTACAAPAGFVASASDCDDADAAVNPAVVELCDGADEDCDGTVDDNAADASSWFADVDGDGWGDSAALTVACSAPVGSTSVDGDCDDADADAFPDSTEVCGDSVDQDCDGFDRRCPIEGYIIINRYGSTWYGETVDDRGGQSVGGGGDTNGDGLDEAMIGAYREDSAGGRAGAAYIVDATGGLLSGAIAKLTGVNPGDHAGASVAIVGDTDGDGYDDVVVGAFLGGTNFAGAAYLVNGPVTGTHSLSTADASIEGASGDDQAGTRVGAAGDVNGDGFADFLVGAPLNDDAGSTAGAVYLWNGPVAGSYSVNDADARLFGEAANVGTGNSANGGDIDGDGFSDLVIGAEAASPLGSLSGQVHVVYGPVSGDFDLGASDARLFGAAAGEQAGYASDFAGDTDGDGYGDVLVGAWGNTHAGTDAGAAYLMRGPVYGDVSLATSDGILYGETAGDAAGNAISRAGDIDADGRQDLLIGAWAEDTSGVDSGAAYVVLSPVSGASSLSDAYAKLVSNGASIECGRSVSEAGDIDGDGYDDVMVGGPDLSTYENGAGGGWVMLGSTLATYTGM